MICAACDTDIPRACKGACGSAPLCASCVDRHREACPACNGGHLDNPNLIRIEIVPGLEVYLIDRSGGCHL